MDTDTRVRSRNKTDARCWRSLIKTSDRISERPPRGGLSVCAYALIQSDNRGTSTLVFYLFFCSKGSGIQSKTLSRPRLMFASGIKRAFRPDHACPLLMLWTAPTLGHLCAKGWLRKANHNEGSRPWARFRRRLKQLGARRAC